MDIKYYIIEIYILTISTRKIIHELNGFYNIQFTICYIWSYIELLLI